MFEGLYKALYPKSIAVVGASNNPAKVGYSALKSVLESFRGRVYPVNPHADKVQGLTAYKSVRDIGERVDLGIICVPAEKAVEVSEEAAEEGFASLLVMSAGFRESEDERGKRLQEALASIAKRHGVRIIGPNTHGFINLEYGLNATFVPGLSGKLRFGGISLIGQSGGVCHHILINAVMEGTGFNKVVNLGNRVDVDFPEMIRFLAFDRTTKVIALHVEGIDKGREFYEAVREASKLKKVVVLKTGRSKIANRASLSHTGSVAGNYEVFRSAMLQAGVAFVESITELMDLSYAYSTLKCSGVKGGGVALITLQGGVGILFSDVLESKGGRLAKLSDKTLAGVRAVLPPRTFRENPIDVSFMGLDEDVLRSIYRLLLEDDNVSIIVLTYAMAPQWELSLNIFEERAVKPTILGLSAEPDTIRRLRTRLEGRGVLVYPGPERAAVVAALLGKYGC